MSEEGERTPDDESEFGPSGEAAWQKLRQHLEWSSAGWIAFLFASSSLQTTELRARAAAWLATHTKRLHVLEPSKPEELATLLETLLDDAPDDADVVWVEALSVGIAGGPLDPWTNAWDAFLLRANERRELLRQHRRGFMFATHASRKARVREAAPDLWSIRAFVIDVALAPGRRRTGTEPYSGLSERSTGPTGAPHADLALLEAERLARTHPEARSERARVLVRAAEGLLAGGRAAEAIARAQEALALAGRGDPERVEALGVLAQAEAEDGDFGAAERHITDTLAATVPVPLWKRLSWFQTRTDLARQRGHLTIAEDVARQMLTEARTDGAPRGISIALDTLGTVLRDRQKLDEAEGAYRESLEVSRGLQKAKGDTPEALRDVSISLDNLGRVLRDRQKLDEAEGAYRESLELDRLLRSRTGDTPQALRDVAVSLASLGTILRDRQQLEEAEGLYREALVLRRLLHSATGDTPQALRDLSISLNDLGGVLRDRQKLDEAESAHREALELSRLLRGATGDTPQALRDVAISLQNLGGVLRERQKLDEAESVFRESVELSRLVRGATGDTPQALRDVSASLHNLGSVLGDRQKPEEAEGPVRESLELSRRLRTATGDTPQGLRDVSVNLNLLGNVLRRLQKLDNAEEAFSESLDLRRRLRIATGDTPQALRDVSLVLSYLVEIAQSRADLPVAAALCREGLEIDRALHMDHRTPLSADDYRWSLQRLSRLERARGNLAEAEALDTELASLGA